MTICKVLSTLPIDENTAIVVEGSRELFRNGIGILDESGKPYEVLSVGMDDSADATIESIDKSSLLVRGTFSSSRIYV